ncbi:MAG: LrgB family protein [Solobacterium sp.]|nr:LrgB family protein [Solobacterium sp.]
MNNIAAASASFGVAVSLLAYYAGTLLKKKFNSGLVNPLLIAIVLTVIFLKLTGIEYTTYNGTAKNLSWFLTPATVSLAIPLYVQIDRLKKNIKAIMISILAGSITSFLCVFVMALFFHLDHAQYVTFLPKSITTAIGMSISEELGGIVPITVVAIIVTGIFGNIIGEGVLKLFRITDPVAKGLAMSTSAHAIGTSKAMEMGETEGAMSSLAIVVAGIIAVVGASLFAGFI